MNNHSKEVGEVARSLKVSGLEVGNEVVGRRVTTRLTTASGYLRKSSLARTDEQLSSEVNRLVKKNLYKLLVESLGFEPVPYGIMHGVRPTKIIQRWLRGGFGVTSQGVIDRDKIVRRVMSDYLTERSKAELLTEVALRQLPIIERGEKKISVYVGIPFCRTRCLYCSFPSNVLPSDEGVEKFMAALRRDVEAAAEAIARYDLKVQTIYIGGGTPSALPEKFFAELLELVTEKFWSADVEEFTVECGRPDTIIAEKISLMKKFSVTRVSVNPQTLHERTLERIGRHHTVTEFFSAYDRLRAANSWQINTDLIIGLPGERLNDFKETLEKILELAPDDVTIHSLAIKRGSRLQVRLSDELNTLKDFDLPSDEEVRRMSEYAAKVLRGEKFYPYYLYRQDYMSGQAENVGWCRRGAEGIYNVAIMGERQTILGVGAAASTKVPDHAAWKIWTSFNAKDLKTYLNDLERYITRRDEILQRVYSADR